MPCSSVVPVREVRPTNRWLLDVVAEGAEELGSLLEHYFGLTADLYAYSDEDGYVVEEVVSSRMYVGRHLTVYNQVARTSGSACRVVADAIERWLIGLSDEQKRQLNKAQPSIDTDDPRFDGWWAIGRQRIPYRVLRIIPTWV